MVTSFKRTKHVLLHSVSPALQQATTDPRLCQRLLDTHRQVWVSLLWGHCSFLLGSGAHKFLFVPSKSLFPSPLYVLRDSRVAQTVKCLPAMWETWVQSLGWEGALEEGMATYSSILAWRIPMDTGA